MYYSSDADVMMGGFAILGAMSVILCVIWLISFVIAIVTYVAMWRLMTKAGKPGWYVLIPFYNTYQLFDMIYPGNGIRFLFLLVPFYNFYVYIKYYIDLAKAFGKDVPFAIGLIFLSPIFMCILGFGSSEYQLNHRAYGASDLKVREGCSRDEAMEHLRQKREQQNRSFDN